MSSDNPNQEKAESKTGKRAADQHGTKTKPQVTPTSGSAKSRVARPALQFAKIFEVGGPSGHLLAGWGFSPRAINPSHAQHSSPTTAGRWPTYPVAHICLPFVQSHDILYRVSQDIPYTPVRAKRAREAITGCLGERWNSGNSGGGPLRLLLAGWGFSSATRSESNSHFGNLPPFSHDFPCFSPVPVCTLKSKGSALNTEGGSLFICGRALAGCPTFGPLLA